MAFEDPSLRELPLLDSNGNPIRRDECVQRLEPVLLRQDCLAQGCERPPWCSRCRKCERCCNCGGRLDTAKRLGYDLDSLGWAKLLCSEPGCPAHAECLEDGCERCQKHCVCKPKSKRKRKS